VLQHISGSYVLRPIMCSKRFGGRLFPAQREIRRRGTAHNRDSLLGETCSAGWLICEASGSGRTIAEIGSHGAKPRGLRGQARAGRVECAAGLRLGGVGISIERACQRRVEAVVYVLRFVTPGSESRGYDPPKRITGSST
jgi:hypothetical protein